MKKYPFFPQKEDMCFASCIQSILAVRGCDFPEQEEISGQFKQLPGGVDLNEECLNKFLKEYDLSAMHILPQECIVEPDVIIRDALGKNLDNLIAFQSGQPKQTNHVSLIQDFNDPQIFLLDPDYGIRTTDLFLLIGSMKNDSRYGFYVIGGV